MKRSLFLCLLFLSLASNALAGNIVCKTSPGIDAKAIASLLKATVVDSDSENNTYVLSTKSFPSLLPFGVQFCEVDKPMRTPKQTFSIVSKTVTSGTALWYQQQPAMQLVNLPAALRISTGRRIVVADINSAVDYGHPALIGHLTAGYDFVAGSKVDKTDSESFLNQSSASFLDQSSASFLDQSSASFLDQSSASFLDQSSASFLDQSSASFLDMANPAHGHGTLVAGIIAAVAPDAMIMPLRVFDDEGDGDIAKITKAIRYAVKNGANVINMSFGLDESSKAIKEAIDKARDAGVIVIASAGNKNSAVPQYPAAYSGVISVAATTNQDKKGSFSNYGTTIDVDAPGANIVSAYPGGYYAVASGTSFAAPIVAGETALLLSYRNTATQAITQGVVKIDALNPGYWNQLGSGRIDLQKALAIQPWSTNNSGSDSSGSGSGDSGSGDSGSSNSGSGSSN